MKKIVNNPDAFVDEMLAGFLSAHGEYLTLVPGALRTIIRADAPVAGKVGLVSGGGSGHLPLFMGYVGRGLLDGCAIGNVFASPSTEQMLAVTRGVNSGRGVLYLYGNYSGDVMNFDMAADLAASEDIDVRTVRAQDDVASAPHDRAARRRGVAGIFFLYKLAGARAQEGASLDDVVRVAETAVANTASMGVALSSCTVPSVGKPTFLIDDDEMEIGMGIHGEPGVRRGKLETADQITATLIEAISDDLHLKRGDAVSVLVNGLGATPLEELYIVYRHVDRLLHESGIHIYRPYIGEFATSMEMAGCSISVLRLDNELKRLLDAPTETPFFRQT